MIATGNHQHSNSLRGAPPLVSKGSLWVLPHQNVYLFQQYFYADEFIMAGGAEEDRPCSERGSEALEENRRFSPATSPTPVRRRGRRRQKHRPGFAGKGAPFLQYPGRPAGDSGGFLFLADTRIGLFGIPATFAPGKSDPGRCFSLKQEGFKLLRLPNLDNKKCEFFVDISLERQYNTEDEPECANIPALRLETRFVSAERQTVRRVIYD